MAEHRIFQKPIHIIANSNRVPNHKSRLTTKPTKWMCAQRSLRSAWASGQSDLSLRCALSGWLRTQTFFMRTANYADSQADLSSHPPRLSWVFAGRTCQFVGFVMRRLIRWLFEIFSRPEQLMCMGNEVFRSFNLYIRCTLDNNDNTEKIKGIPLTIFSLIRAPSLISATFLLFQVEQIPFKNRGKNEIPPT